MVKPLKVTPLTVLGTQTAVTPGGAGESGDGSLIGPSSRGSRSAWRVTSSTVTGLSGMIKAVGYSYSSAGSITKLLSSTPLRPPLMSMETVYSPSCM